MLLQKQKVMGPQDLETPRGAIMHKTVMFLTLMSALAGVDARANQITNGSFEDTNKSFVGDVNKTDQLASGSAAIPGWTTINGVPTAWIRNGNPWNISASNGSYFLDLTGYSDFGTYGGVTQSFATTPGTGYVVTFDLGYGGNSGLFGGPVSVRATAAGFTGSFVSGTGTANPAGWGPGAFLFTAASGPAPMG